MLYRWDHKFQHEMALNFVRSLFSTSNIEAEKGNMASKIRIFSSLSALWTSWLRPRHIEPNRRVQNSSLLKLPAELRNRIYFLVVMEPDPQDDPAGDCYIDITADLKQPGLVRTCHQLRGEGLVIWYSNSVFFVDVDDCNSSLALKFEKHLAMVGFPEACLVPVTDGKDWDNLMVWSEAVWRQACRPMLEEDDTDFDETEAVVIAAHNVALQYRQCVWGDCKNALENLRLVVVTLDKEWVKT
ncbi:hypothetical protein LTR85_005556 [Meristemomyces frigidus]|nr:hypothetical protein LTR85_005556 [Meristemomyces frigidus]